MVYSNSIHPTTELTDIVRARGVVYEVWPEVSYATGQLMHVGYSLDLYGTPDRGTSMFPGSPRCERAYRELRRLADAILPPDPDATSHHIVPYDRSLHVLANGARREIRVRTRIEHRSNYNSPIDPSERRYLERVRGRLATLGVTSRH